MGLSFDGVDDYCEVPVAVGVFRIYNRALSDEEIRGHRIAGPVAIGLFVIYKKGDLQYIMKVVV